jgi:hypothetical protein
MLRKEGIVSALTEVVTPKSEAGKVTTAASRKPARPAELPANLRYFLAKESSSSSVPQFGKELANENEALIESVRSGLTYFVISEWKAIADLSGKAPQILKESVRKFEPGTEK